MEEKETTYISSFEELFKWDNKRGYAALWNHQKHLKVHNAACQEVEKIDLKWLHYNGERKYWDAYKKIEEMNKISEEEYKDGKPC